MQHPWAGVGWAQLNFVDADAIRGPGSRRIRSCPLAALASGRGARYPGNSRCCNAGHRRALAGAGPARSVRKRRTGPHRRCRPAAAQHRYTACSNTRSGSATFDAHCICAGNACPRPGSNAAGACSVDHQHSARRQIDVGAVDRVHGDAAVDRNRLGVHEYSKASPFISPATIKARAPTPLPLPAPARSTVSTVTTPRSCWRGSGAA